MVLERGMPVRLGQMSRVSGLRKEGQISQAEAFDDCGILLEACAPGLLAQGRMDQEQAKRDDFRRCGT